MTNQLEEQASSQGGARQINECDYLLLKDIGAREDLTLALIVAEAKPQAPILTARNNSPLEQLLLGARPIREDVSCRRFEIAFEGHAMVSYSVLNAVYGKYPEAPEAFTGKLFRVFSWSYLLENIKKTTNASDRWPGPLEHYQVVCSNHVIDVICTQPPLITLLARKALCPG